LDVTPHQARSELCGERANLGGTQRHCAIARSRKTFEAGCAFGRDTAVL
jgi:hypothetical protein